MADPVVIDEDITNMIFRLNTVAMAPTTVGPYPQQVFVGGVPINPDQSISDPVELEQETQPTHTSNLGGVKYPPGYERYDAYFHIAAYILLELKQGNCGGGDEGRACGGYPTTGITSRGGRGGRTTFCRNKLFYFG
jgi:hypothetical protein